MAGKQYELWAEALRDIGILFFVFAPLDTLFRPGHGSSSDWLLALAIAITGLFLIALGVRMGSDS